MNRTRVKLCGLTRADDVVDAIEAGADMLGFVFDHGPCRISLAEAGALLRTARGGAHDVCCVAVVGQLSLETLAAIRALGFDALQMEASAYAPAHDGAPWSLPAFFDDGRLAERVPPFRQAHAPRFSTLADAQDDPRSAPRGLINVDGRGGGSGTRSDWQAAAALARTGPLMLAGGLTPDNVQHAIEVVAPAAVDVSSGIEATPGRKERARMHAFVAAVRG